jgi:pimeloyl-[acyl-carrier protein] methyl ester esterase
VRLILLHGWTMAGDVFDPLRAALPGIDCIAPDLPGHGAGAADRPASIAGGAALLGDLLRAGPAVVVGWSMGALVAWQHVARHGPGGMAALITIDMSPRPFPDWDFGLSGLTPDSARSQTARFRANWSDAAQAMSVAMFASLAGSATMSRDQAAARIGANDPAVMLPFWDEILTADHRATVATLPVPCLAIHGAKSRVYPPATAAWIARTAPRGQATVVTDAGHAPILENPAGTAAAILAFLKTLPGDLR